MKVDSNPASIITGSPTVYNGVVYVGVSSYEEGWPPSRAAAHSAARSWR